MSGAAVATVPERESGWEEWRRMRDDVALRPFGTASLDRTEWPDETPRRLAGLPGRWHRNGGEIVGETSSVTLRLRAGDRVELGALHVQHFARDGASRLRVYDPASTHRTSIEEIEAFPFDPDWIVTGRFRAAGGDDRIEVETADGRQRTAALAGTAALDTPGGAVELTLTRGADGGLSAVVSDASTRSGTYRFRFLDIDEPEGAGITVDFNRAHLPPCAFSPEYVCPLPPPGNRWDIAVEAGERRVRRAQPAYTRRQAVTIEKADRAL